MRFFSSHQVVSSIERLRKVHPFLGITFLAFKKIGLPVGEQISCQYSTIRDVMLEPYFKVIADHNGYYNPFLTSKGEEDRWVNSDYARTTLQRYTADTFGTAFIHEKRTVKWGWRPEYVEEIRKVLESRRLPPAPIFDMAVWLYREKSWDNDTIKDDIIGHFIEDFSITDRERNELFCDGSDELFGDLFSDKRMTPGELIETLGWPEDYRARGGAALKYIELKNIGPAKSLVYNASDRLNMLTGDNSTGKTFLIECIWWALTGRWIDYPADPRRTAAKSSARIKFCLQTELSEPQRYDVRYDWAALSWNQPEKRKLFAGLAIYSRHDGSFVVWDPARSTGRDSPIPSEKSENEGHIVLDLKSLWDGLEVKDRHGKVQFICNGMVRDWVTWQTGGTRYAERYAAFIKCLRTLSPRHSEVLVPGEPTRIPGDSREMPTLVLPYGVTPLPYASAGIKRIIGISYVLVWTWYEHYENSRQKRQATENRLVFLADEIEAHLHPQWQRSVVPSIMEVIESLSSDISSQVHLATHSPMVLASVEPIFRSEQDSLHHLRVDDGDVVDEVMNFAKHGSSDGWLTSDVFGVSNPRSIPAGEVIERAKELQLSDNPDPVIISQIDKELTELLASDDPFWPRWRFFAIQNARV